MPQALIAGRRSDGKEESAWGRSIEKPPRIVKNEVVVLLDTDNSDEESVF